MTTEHSMQSDEKRMRLRYAGTCHLCGTDLPAGEPAIYERSAKRVRCISCLGSPAEVPVAVASDPALTEPQEIAAGTAGASARREYKRRRDSREARIRKKYPKLGGLILALSDEPQSTRAWEGGAIGEELMAARLKNLPEPARVLNDRRIPGTRANIDHLVIAPSGVWVIDAKRYKGKRPELRIDGGIIRPRVESLRIGGRDGTGLVDGVRKQLALVRSALDDPSIPVHGVLCFIESDWPLVGGSFTVDGVHVLWPRLLLKRIGAGPVQELDVAAVHSRIAARFPVA